MRILSIAFCLASVVLSSCGPRFAGHGNYEIRGTLVDSETGALISRKEIYVHVFNDAIKDQTSLEQEDESTFTVRIPVPEVRLRVYDPTNKYEVYETNVVVPKSGLDQVVHLVPTHFVLLKGHLMVFEAGAWVPLRLELAEKHGESHYALHFALDGGREGPWNGNRRDDGSFAVRLPRDRFRVQLLCSELGTSDLVDLTGVTTDVVERDIRLTP